MHNRDFNGNPLIDHFNLRLSALAYHHMLMLDLAAPHLYPLGLDEFGFPGEQFPIMALPQIVPDAVIILDDQEEEDATGHPS
jgi:hypothetical protein